MGLKPVATILVLDGPTHYGVELPVAGKMNFVAGDTIIVFDAADVAAARALPFAKQIKVKEFPATAPVVSEAQAPDAAEKAVPEVARKAGRRG